MTSYAHMADAAFAANIPPGFQIAAGYIPGRADYHPWAPSDWGLFPGFRLPITVPANPGDGPLDGHQAAAYLSAILGVPEGCTIALDMEGREDAEYVTNFGAALAGAGYKTWVYGSAGTVYGNPPLNGYWVADYGLTAGQMMTVLETPHVRAIQYASYPAFDVSLVKAWTEGEMWHG